MNEKNKTCCICNQPITGWGNNPWPVAKDGECCEHCNYTVVIPARLKKMKENNSDK